MHNIESLQLHYSKPSQASASSEEICVFRSNSTLIRQLAFVFFAIRRLQSACNVRRHQGPSKYYCSIIISPPRFAGPQSMRKTVSVYLADIVVTSNIAFGKNTSFCGFYYKDAKQGRNFWPPFHHPGRRHICPADVGWQLMLLHERTSKQRKSGEAL